MSRSLSSSLALRFALLAGLVQVGSAQTTWFVDDDGCPGPGDGSVTTPFCSIQSAVSAASDGDFVLVYPGTYTDVDFAGKEIQVISFEGPGNTIIQAVGVGVRFDKGEGPGALLRGFQITGASEHGILCDGASPTIEGNRIRKNSALNGGGGLYIVGDSSPHIVGNSIEKNTCVPGMGAGGGLYISNSSPTIERNIIRGNDVFADYGGGEGAGLFIQYSTVELHGNLIINNRATDESRNVGGGICAVKSTIIGSSNTFSGNRSMRGLAVVPELPGTPGKGGALHLVDTQTTFTDTIFWNDAADLGPEVYAEGGSVKFSYSNMQGGLAKIAGRGAVSFGEGMLDTQPQWHAFHLLHQSPLVDAGSPSRRSIGTDWDLDPRAVDGNGDGVERVDIGWDEYNVVQLEVEGKPVLGGSFSVHVNAFADLHYILAGAIRTADVERPPFGAVLIGVPRVVFAKGLMPASHKVAVPNESILYGMRVSFQAFGYIPRAGRGSFSRRADFTIR